MLDPLQADPSVIQSPYKPRKQFGNFHLRDKRISVMVIHRRAGKTVACVNDLIAKAAYNKRVRPRYAYIAPLRNQAKGIAWDYLKYYSQGLTSKISESELYVEFKHNGARISVYGADNPDSFRGLYFDGVVFDEYGQMNPIIYTQIIMPTVADRKGWIVFIGTPEGKNHFFDQFRKAEADPSQYYSYLLKASQSGILSKAELDFQRREMGDDEKYEREYECSFQAMVKGEYYSKLIVDAENEHRISDLVEYDPQFPVEVAFDLGYTDSTAFWFWQTSFNHIKIIDYEEYDSEPLQFYFDLLRAKPYQYEKVWLPHDARAKTLSTERTTVEQFLRKGFPIDIAPNVKKMHGIDAVRYILPQCVFRQETCSVGIEALRAYKRKWDEKKKVLSDEAVHDWASHGADAFRYLSLVCKERIVPTVTEPPPPTELEAEPVCLEDLFQEYESRQKRRRRMG